MLKQSIDQSFNSNWLHRSDHHPCQVIIATLGRHAHGVEILHRGARRGISSSNLLKEDEEASQDLGSTVLSFEAPLQESKRRSHDRASHPTTATTASHQFCRGRRRSLAVFLGFLYSLFCRTERRRKKARNQLRCRIYPGNLKSSLIAPSIPYQARSSPLRLHTSPSYWTSVFWPT